MTDKKNSLTYAEAGVDIDAGNALVRAIAPLAKATRRTGAESDLGGFGGLFDLAACNFKDPVLVAANDGVGTKLKIAIEVDKHDTIGIDLVAMSVNDLVVQGAEPLFFLDYFATSALDVARARDVIAGIAKGASRPDARSSGARRRRCPAFMRPRITIWPVFRSARLSGLKFYPHPQLRPAIYCWDWRLMACIPTVFRWCVKSSKLSALTGTRPARLTTR